MKSRIVTLAAIVIAALLLFVIALVDASQQTRESFRRVTHSSEVIEVTDDLLSGLRDAESGQRGFVLTHNPLFAKSFVQQISAAERAAVQLEKLTVDNPIQHTRAKELKGLVADRIEIMRQNVQLAQSGNFEQASAKITDGRGRDVMTTLTLRSQNFLEQEHALQQERIETAERRLSGVKTLALIGGPIIACLVLFLSWTIYRGIQQPIELLHQTMKSLGDGDKRARITARMGTSEFEALGQGYNAMADRLDTAIAQQGSSEQQLQVANEELLHNTQTLRDRGEVIELLGGMAHRMQAARTDDELAQVVRIFVPRVLPNIPGVLYAHNNSRNLLKPITSWGNLDTPAEGFAPEECWALRRGQAHYLDEPNSDIICGHLADAHQVYHCEPLLASGEIIGTLYLQGKIDNENRFRLNVLAENIASALVNHRLQRDLREQTIRDPLTGLFNRRYMEEALAVEIARSKRTEMPLSVAMCDVDHFKRFNDDFGHDAGDAVLKAVAAELGNYFRDGDIVCRFGGEEFTIVAPGASAEALAERIEKVRQAITEINLRQGGRTLGSTSMSFGIATWERHMDREGAALIRAADTALYRAKSEGRNRAVIQLGKAA